MYQHPQRFKRCLICAALSRFGLAASIVRGDAKREKQE
jgi:hypothetical protein